jgi:hypothetical protein
MQFVKLLAAWTLLLGTASADIDGLPQVSVGGAVPRPGPIAIEAGMTIGDALAAVGMDSKSLEVAREMPEGQPYPLRIIRYRKSVHDVFKTRAGVEAAMPLSMAEGDPIVVEDFRLLDGKIKQASENLTEAVALGSVDTCTALTDLVNLRQEQAKWPEPVGDGGPEREPLLRQELGRLAKAGQGSRVTQLLELQRESLFAQGLGKVHPTAVALTRLIELSRESAAKAGPIKAAIPPSVVFSGMYLVDLEQKMLAGGAEATMYEVEVNDPDHKGLDLHYFALKSGEILEVVSEPGQFGRRVAVMKISTSKPKSRDSKVDPERDKFLASFKEIKEYDLAATPKSQQDH